MNLFTDVVEDYCLLPPLAVEQGCTSVPLHRSEITGVFILPLRAPLPTDWTTSGGWAGVIDNTDSSLDSGRYLAGIGSLEPGEQEPASMSGGRVLHNLPRQWVFNFLVRDMDANVLKLAGKVENGWTGFRFWLETLGGRLIGGPTGMGAFTASAVPRWASGTGAKEQVDFRFTAFFLAGTKVVEKPEILAVPVDLSGCDDAYLAENGTDIYITTGGNCYLLN